jgi:cytochrome c oxidase subunit II
MVLAGCTTSDFGVPEPVTEQGDSVRDLWSGFFLGAVAVTLLVWVLLAYVLVRYRRRAGDEDHIPEQRPYNIPVEIAYTAIPIVVVAGLFFFSWRTERDVVAVDAEPAVRVEVVGFQWGWRFHYPDEGFTVDAEPGIPPEMVLPVGVPSNLRLDAADVIHSFWVPEFLSKRDLIPNVHNEITVTPTKTGSYTGRCAEFCGLDHWRMYFSVRLVPMEEYQEWVAARQQEGP